MNDDNLWSEECLWHLTRDKEGWKLALRIIFVWQNFKGQIIDYDRVKSG